ncbi:uncharacterized protein LOC133860331 [Alnus glutinosa]|uniref:uncharacterized protein LOC133860331 n=1 Tax=Alnus glutinosa TaxID=3517 RepID=UPI002D79D36F|nr:uncharacterized protein LOC133860331 [Alnus glutinosa]
MDAAEHGSKKKFPEYNWTPLNRPIEEVLTAIKMDPMYEKPTEIVGTPNPRTAHRYCAFHESKGHSTETCISLRALIENFIENGKLVRFLVTQRGQQGFGRNPQTEEQRSQPQRYREKRGERLERPRDCDREPKDRPSDRDRRGRSRSQARQPARENLLEIHMISCGFGGGGESSAARKAYARYLKDFKVYSVQRPPKMRKYENQVISFSNEDLARVSFPHSDALVVTLAIANHSIHRVLVDIGSSADIIYKSAFKLMSIEQKELAPIRGPLIGFTGKQVLPIGAIELPVMAGTSPRQKTIMVKFGSGWMFSLQRHIRKTGLE